MMQTILVLITFCIALGYLLKKFVWTPIVETRFQPKSKNVKKSVCGHNNCGCH